jgi:predicted alpha/beta-fold hydrolase
MRPPLHAPLSVPGDSAPSVPRDASSIPPQTTPPANDSALTDRPWFVPFVPRRYLGQPVSQPDAQTILANFLPREVQLTEPESVLVEVEESTQSHVLCHCHWQPPEVRASRLTMLLLHGLEGSSQSQYMLGNASKALRAGWNVIRMNMRNCGGTEAISPTLYHSGLSGDVAAVAEHFVAREHLQSVAFVGYSMGGNMVLKCTGEWGAQAPAWLKAVVGVSPLIDLSASADALHSLRNRLYEWNFLLNMLRLYRKKARLFPEHFPIETSQQVNSIRSFDEYIVSPNCGFASADDYHYRAAAARVIDRIAVPTLLLHSLDDPFIRLLPETRARILANPAITLVETEHGGHCAFLAQPEGEDDGYWAEQTLVRYLRWVLEGRGVARSASEGLR